MEGKMENFFGVLITTFGIVFVAELGDKTQIASGVGALANRRSVWWVFTGSVVALTIVALLTTILAGFIPARALPTVEFFGGVSLVIYGLYIAWKARKVEDVSEEEPGEEKKGWKLFLAQFIVVFLAEIGDKTQVFTAGAAIRNSSNLLAVFIGSASALVCVTGITVWGVSLVPKRFIQSVQITGGFVLLVYGLYMMASSVQYHVVP